MEFRKLKIGSAGIEICASTTGVFFIQRNDVQIFITLTDIEEMLGYAERVTEISELENDLLAKKEAYGI